MMMKMGRREFSGLLAAGALAVVPGRARAGERALPGPGAEPVFPDRDFPVTEFGAREGGHEKNTEAFARAIEACAASGGGRVVAPAGRWLCGAIHLKSNVNLHLEEGATLVFSADPADYLPPVFTRWEGVECFNYSPLVYGRGLDNVAITGAGILDGHGSSWWGWKLAQVEAVKRLYDAEHDGVAVKDRVFGTVADALRPPLVQLVDCRRVLLAGYTGKDSPFWTNHLVYCEDVTVDGVRVLAPAISPNTDGVNLDSCRRAVVRGIYVSTGDDAVCVKSGRDEDGWRVGRPCADVLIEDCHVERAHGGFVVGSEISGGIENVVVQNCRYVGAQRGVRIKSRPGRGGYIRGLDIRGLELGEISVVAVVVNMRYDSHRRPGRSRAPSAVEGIRISGVRCRSARGSVEVVGLNESPIRRLSLDGLEIKSVTGMDIREVEDLVISDSRVDPLAGPVVKLTGVTDARITGCAAPPYTFTFLKVEKGSSGIALENNDLKNALLPVRTAPGVGPGAVKNI